MSRKLNFSEEHVLMKLDTVAVDDLRMCMNKGDNSRDNIIPHLHNLFLFQCDVTRSLNRSEARSKLFIDQGRTTLYRLLSTNTGVMLCLHRIVTIRIIRHMWQPFDS